jgi:hypothetical protein
MVSTIGNSMINPRLQEIESQSFLGELENNLSMLKGRREDLNLRERDFLDRTKVFLRNNTDNFLANTNILKPELMGNKYGRYADADEDLKDLMVERNRIEAQKTRIRSYGEQLLRDPKSALQNEPQFVQGMYQPRSTLQVSKSDIFLPKRDHGNFSMLGQSLLSGNPSQPRIGESQYFPNIPAEPRPIREFDRKIVINKPVIVEEDPRKMFTGLDLHNRLRDLREMKEACSEYDLKNSARVNNKLDLYIENLEKLGAMNPENMVNESKVIQSEFGARKEIE